MNQAKIIRSIGITDFEYALNQYFELNPEININDIKITSELGESNEEILTAYIFFK